MSAIAAELPRLRGGRRMLSVLALPELVGLLGLTAALNLWNLGINGWANTYYSAAPDGYARCYLTMARTSSYQATPVPAARRLSPRLQKHAKL